MNTFRFTAITQCGKTNIIIQMANSLWEAKDKLLKHNILKHSTMNIIKTEVMDHGIWCRV